MKRKLNIDICDHNAKKPCINWYQNVSSIHKFNNTTNYLDFFNYQVQKYSNGNNKDLLAQTQIRIELHSGHFEYFFSVPLNFLHDLIVNMLPKSKINNCDILQYTNSKLVITSNKNSMYFECQSNHQKLYEFVIFVMENKTLLMNLIKKTRCMKKIFGKVNIRHNYF